MKSLDTPKSRKIYLQAGPEITEMMEFAERNFNTLITNMANTLKEPAYPRSSKTPMEH